MGTLHLMAGVALAFVMFVYVSGITRMTIVARRRIARSSESDGESLAHAWLRSFRLANSAIVCVGAARGGIVYHDEPGFMPRGLIGIACIVVIACLAALTPIPRSLALLYTWPVRAGLTRDVQRDG